MRTRPWERTQMNSSINTQATEYGPRTFANFGLTQGFVWKERWAFDVGVDQTNTLRGPDLEPLNPNAPLASGSMTEDFFAAFVGASYRHELWQMHEPPRASQFRFARSAGARPRAGIASRSKATRCRSRCRPSIPTRCSASPRRPSGRFAWAFRPDSSHWIVFDRFELKYDDQCRLVRTRSSRRAW